MKYHDNQAFYSLKEFGESTQNYNDLNDQVKNRISAFPFLAEKGAVFVYQNKNIINKVINDYYHFNYREINGSTGRYYQFVPVRNFESYTIVNEMIKIINNKGLDLYSNVIIPEYENKSLILIATKIIKPNKTLGNFEKVIKDEYNGYYHKFSLDNKEYSKSDTIYIEKFSDINYNNLYKSLLKFKVSGAEVGDFINIIKIYYSPRANYSEDVYFNSYLPVLNSKITINNYFGLKTKINAYNGAYLSNKEETTYSTICNYEKTLLQAIDLTNFKAYKELPYIRFSITKYRESINNEVVGKDIMPETWENIAKEIKNVYYNHYTSIDVFHPFYLENYINKILKQNNNDTIKTLYTIHDTICKNISIKPFVKKWYKPSQYYLRKKIIDRYHLSKLYYDIFRYLKIKTDLCIAKDKFLGTIDSSITCFQGDKDFIFYCFYDKNNKKHFIITKESNEFAPKIDEIPSNFQGALSVSIPFFNYLPKDSSCSFFYLPSKDFTNNKIIRKNFMSIDLKNKKAEDSLDFNYYGNFVNEMKESIENIKNENYRKGFTEDIIDYKLSNAKISSYNYTLKNSTDSNKTYNVSIKLTDGNYLYTKDSIYYHVPLKYLVYNRIINPGDISKRKYDWSENYTYTDKYYLTLDIIGSDYEILNEQNFNESFSNEIGDYYISLKKENNKILISTGYKLKKSTIKKEDLNKLTFLYNKADEYLNKLIIIKVKY